jgi:hypothetical protein
MGKCMFTLSSNDKKIHWHCYRLRELFPCYVSAIFAFIRVLTFTAFRLNHRDIIQAQSSHSGPSQGFQLDSVQPNRKSQKSRTGSAVTVTVHRTATTDFSAKMHTYDNEQGLDKSVRIFTLLWQFMIDIRLSEGGNNPLISTQWFTHIRVKRVVYKSLAG